MKLKSASVTMLVFILVSVPFLGPASATFHALEQVSHQAASTRWGVSPAGFGAPSQSSPLLVIWQVQRNTAYSYFDAVNTGIEPLSQFLLITESVGQVAKPEKASLTFERCDGGTWDLTNNSCSGVIVELSSYSGPNALTIVIAQAIEVGERSGFRVTTAQNRRNDLSTSISFGVTTSAIRSSAMVSS